MKMRHIFLMLVVKPYISRIIAINLAFSLTFPYCILSCCMFKRSSNEIFYEKINKTAKITIELIRIVTAKI